MRLVIEAKLNDMDVNVRLAALRELKKMIDNGEIQKPCFGNDVNNHIHTTYSFSPYTPTAAVYYGYMAGLKTAGIMDHDSLAGAREFVEAGKIMEMATTIGVECRVSFKGTPIENRRINNPDQNTIAYVTLHGIPHTQIDVVDSFMRPKIEARLERNKKMVNRINTLLKRYDIELDFEKDIIPVSYYKFGGTVTERHILFALAQKIIKRFGKGQAVVDFLENSLKIKLSDKARGFLKDEGNKVYEYDLLGALKSDMVELFYVQAKEECPTANELALLAEKTGAIMAYAYLGDVGNSVTGDKKAQKFEDDYLELLFDTITKKGFKTVTYMPSRNTKEQIIRLKGLCQKYNMLEISGEDINSPRQSFICLAQRDEMFSNLVDSTWALIAHEKAATQNLENSFFSEKTIEKYPALEDRINAYKNSI